MDWRVILPSPLSPEAHRGTSEWGNDRGPQFQPSTFWADSRACTIASMLAEILTFGDELCRGEIVDTNSSWLAAELWDLEVTCAWMTSCRDEAEDMRQALR